jgi:aminoglycoside phosphotransferase (APT) family kinase protein
LAATTNGCNGTGNSPKNSTVVLPAPDPQTLSTYLLNAAEAIHRQINGGLQGDAATRLTECATIVARVAQQLSAGSNAPNRDFGAQLAALTAAEATFAQAESQRSVTGKQAATGLERRIDARAIETYLRAHSLGGASLQVADARLISGGRCKTTGLVVQNGGRQLPREFIFRQDWQGGATDTTVAGEFTLLECVCAANICAPRPLLLEKGSTNVGPPFILLERLPGKIAGSLFTPPLSSALALQLAEQMGRLHSLPQENFRDVVPDGTKSPEQRYEMLDAFRQTHAKIGIRSCIIDTAIEWLGKHLGDVGAALCLTHNDLGFHNFLTEGEHLTAILDWELAALGHPAADLGYVKPFVELMLPWRDFVLRYQQAGGWRVDPRVLRFHTIWNAVRLYGLIMQARAALVSGHVSDVEITYACADQTMRLLLALGGELERVAEIFAREKL